MAQLTLSESWAKLHMPKIAKKFIWKSHHLIKKIKMLYALFYFMKTFPPTSPTVRELDRVSSYVKDLSGSRGALGELFANIRYCG